MKLKVVFAPEARDDLFELYDYIAHYGSPDRAMAYIERIERACMSLQTLPNRGTLREDLRQGLRVMGFERRALIAFRVNPGSVAILRILYGGRSAERAFRRFDES
ncbi:MAG: type II toxin-antitoxin system RelE/ParE family toxin [Terracidiphilus sp.]